MTMTSAEQHNKRLQKEILEEETKLISKCEKEISQARTIKVIVYVDEFTEYTCLKIKRKYEDLGWCVVFENQSKADCRFFTMSSN